MRIENDVVGTWTVTGQVVPGQNVPSYKLLGLLEFRLRINVTVRIMARVRL